MIKRSGSGSATSKGNLRESNQGNTASRLADYQGFQSYPYLLTGHGLSPAPGLIQAMSGSPGSPGSEGGASAGFSHHSGTTVDEVTTGLHEMSTSGGSSSSGRQDTHQKEHKVSKRFINKSCILLKNAIVFLLYFENPIVFLLYFEGASIGNSTSFCRLAI